ncbi:MAG: FKBP-type peptidyl-prolyl cis-trans isomerase [Reichenbachiella sp.]|uniref:FKBP-type peptidyl-prolyl cis-trans isomerase n=1 Tax=Reichenbachiella sp. TaxID=2184521 RepID=UPI002966B8CA|nr:FKBP-type peptidyl-prolyl cis-trans isomerase [Reichenbachiella sp.]MDW3210422.1 FKBP-type peptidyl-prolyl cis-trans isomerase [Reichenbachiella sp.]
MKNYKFQVLSNINILVVGMVLLSSCFEESEYEKQQKESDLQIKTYLQNNNIEAQKADNGIYYKMLTTNESGTSPKPGEVMMVKYEMKTLDGYIVEQFTADSSLIRYGNSGVIPIGFNYGIDVMHTGEKIRAFIPSYLAYNSFAGKDEFGPNTNFILDIELLDISTEDKIYKTQIDQIEAYITQEGLGDITPTTSGLYFSSLEPGDGEEAKTYHIATLHYTRKYLDGSIIQETEENDPLVVSLGTNQLVKGFREGVLKMREGEKALLIMPSELAFGASVKVIPASVREELYQSGHISSLVDAYQIVQYEVELLELN